MWAHTQKASVLPQEESYLKLYVVDNHIEDVSRLILDDPKTEGWFCSIDMHVKVKLFWITPVSF